MSGAATAGLKNSVTSKIVKTCENCIQSSKKSPTNKFNDLLVQSGLFFVCAGSLYDSFTNNRPLLIYVRKISTRLCYNKKLISLEDLLVFIISLN